MTTILLTTPPAPLTCAFCLRSVPDRDAAAEAGWQPSFYAGDQEYDVPACPACCGQHLRLQADGEMELLAGHKSALRGPGMARGFYHTTKAWWFQNQPARQLPDGVVDEIMFGLYGADGSGGSVGEMAMRWHLIDPLGEFGSRARLEVFADAWLVLRGLTDVVDGLAELGAAPGVQQVLDLLVRCDFRDMTPRQRPASSCGR